jgi:hypothetical protein
MQLNSQTPRRLLVISCLSLIATALAPAAVAEGFNDRTGAPTETEMLARGDRGLEGLAFVRPVLNGVLYRAGFKGGDKAHAGLATAQRLALCEAGFTGARYVDFGSKTQFGTTQCAEGTLDYSPLRSSRTAALMQDIHAVIEDPDKGPILVHCMWGVHSSGAVAAMALTQFCGWSESQAKTYWHKARNNAPCGSAGCDRWIDDKFRNFQIDPELELTEQQRASICPPPPEAS